MVLQNPFTQPSHIANRVVSTGNGIQKTSQLCVHPCPACHTAQRGAIDNQVARSAPTDFDRIRAELVELREGVDALVAHIFKADETLHRLNATHEELRGILESINDRPPRASSDTPSSNPWAIPPDHIAFSTAHFNSNTFHVEDMNLDRAPQRNPALLDDDADSEYLSTTLGLTDWSDVPPRNGYYPTVSAYPRAPTNQPNHLTSSSMLARPPTSAERARIGRRSASVVHPERRAPGVDLPQTPWTPPS